MCAEMMQWGWWWGGGVRRLWQLPSSLLFFFFFFPKASVVGASYKRRYTSNSHANGGGDLEKKGGEEKGEMWLLKATGGMGEAGRGGVGRRQAREVVMAGVGRVTLSTVRGRCEVAAALRNRETFV